MPSGGMIGGMTRERLQVSALGPEDEAVAEALLGDELGGRQQARLGDLVDVLAWPGFGAWSDHRLVGVATWFLDPADRGRAELAALAVADSYSGRGVGGLLTERVVAVATAAGCSTLWLVTTNDNLPALRLYQRPGFRLAELRAGAVEQARAAKPSIPAIGKFGIPLRDELILERRL